MQAEEIPASESQYRLGRRLTNSQPPTRLWELRCGLIKAGRIPDFICIARDGIKYER